MLKKLRPFLMAAGFIIGLSLPSLHVLSPLIPWFIRFMLLIVFLKMDFRQVRFYKSQFGILLLTLGLAVGAWKLLTMFGYPELGLAAFFTAVAPTGTAAPVVTGFLGRKVEYVATSVILSTVCIAGALIFLIPFILGKTTPDLFLNVTLRVGSVIILPLTAALILRAFFPKIKQQAARLSTIVFLAWVAVLTIILSGASEFFRTNENVPLSQLAAVAGISLAVCVLNFLIGYWTGERENRREASQSMGQKNTSITIWLAVAYANPFVALGPTLYVLYHNGWNALQLEMHARRQGKQEAASEKDLPVGQNGSGGEKNRELNRI